MAFSPEQLAIADKFMECRILRADAQAYQDLLVSVLELRHTDFRTVKPQGKFGDRKNDGYIPSEGRYYQVYAPEDGGVSGVTTTIKKIQADFKGLLKFWQRECPIRAFRFALNDKFKGAYPEVERALLKLKNTHRLEECGPFLAKDLMSEFSQLDERHILRLIGPLPSSEMIAPLDYGIFTGVLEHVINYPTKLTPDALLRVPDFSEKIRLNGLSDTVAGLLRSGNLQSGAVEDFFESHGGFSRRAIRDKLAELYASLRDQFRTDSTREDNGDLIFIGLLDAVTDGQSKNAARDAGIVLLSYFFETCDIYEDPSLL